MDKTIIFGFGKKKYRLTRRGKEVLLFLSILSYLLFLEFLVRVLIPYPLEKEYMIFSCFNYKPIPESKLNLNGELFWKPNKFNVKDAPDLRIICLGDSVTAGHEAMGKNLEEGKRWTAKLEKKLRNYFNTKKILKQ